jgi:galactokinase
VIGAPATLTLGELLERDTQLLACARALRAAGVGRTRPVSAFFVPGRIEVLGKHTDYAGGRSLLAALERGFTVVAAPRRDEFVTLIDATSRQRARFPLSAEIRPERGGWHNYPMTVARRIALNFPGARCGADIAFSSTLPAAAGMSSSSAFVTATFLALAAANRLDAEAIYRSQVRSAEELADYLGAIENGLTYRALVGVHGVGTNGGSQDHTAILCARPGALVQYAFRPVRFERAVALPPGYTFAIASSGVRASKAGAARAHYNRAAERTRRLLEVWREYTGREDHSLGAALESSTDAARRLAAALAATPATDGLLPRLEQFAAESLEIIPAASSALEAGDLATFGILVDRSQQLAEQGLDNQIAETIHLARSARELGATASSAFGAGFGGSVWAFVAEREGAAFLEAWRANYLARFPARAGEAAFFLSGAGEGARRVG